MRAKTAEGSRVSAPALVAAPGAGPVHVEVEVQVAGPRGLPRTAERYWLLHFEDDELRFTQRAAAERWASKLAARGMPSKLTWHDEHTPQRPGGRPEGRVANPSA